MILEIRSNGDFDFRYLEPCGEVKPADELKKLIGVSEDKKSGSIIVTYRHIVERHRLSKVEPLNVKVGEWVTKYNLTSAVVYDETLDKYIGVFHEYTIREWDHETSDLGQTKKYTFQSPILKILTRQEKVPLIIFRNGNCVTLPYGQEHYKTFRRRAQIQKSSMISDVVAYTRNDTEYVCYVVNDNSNFYHIVTIPIKDEVADTSKVNTVKVCKMRERQEEVKITGIKLGVPSGAQFPVVYVTWNDSRVSRYDVIRKHWKHKIHRHWFSDDVSMTCVGKNYFFINTKRGKSAPEMSVRHAFNEGTTFSFEGSTNSHSKKTEPKMCKTADFMVVADTSNITVWNVEFNPYSRPPLWRRDDMIAKLVDELRKPEEYLPIFGYSEISTWNRLSRYRTVK